MELDALWLARIQFALTIMFHYIFPPLTIGLGILMVIIEGLWLKTGKPIYETSAKFWTKLFALNFALGVATGIVMEFEFGTNWAVYSCFVGDVFGSALAAEGIFAFFLESGFLSILVFGWDKVSRPVHFFSALMVCLGSIFSSIWITVANSWQQTPAGYRLVTLPNGMQRAEILDFWTMVFNPSTIPRLLHVWAGAFVLGAFFALSVCAFYILKNKHQEFARLNFKIALIYAAAASLLGAATGHLQACEVADYQPAKLAAIEAHYDTGSGGTGLYLFGIPDEKTKTVRFGLKIPALLSLLIYCDPDKPVTGLDKFEHKDWPPVFVPFTTFHLMVGLGSLFVLITSLALIFWWRGNLFQQRWLLWIFVFSAAAALATNELGWVTAEVGRQPWIVYGLLRTSEAVSLTVKASHILASIIMFSFIYLLLFLVWIYVLHNKIVHGPEQVSAQQLPSHSPHQGTQQEQSTQAGLLHSAAARANPAGDRLVTEEITAAEVVRQQEQDHLPGGSN